MPDCDHRWKWVPDWYGDPSIPNGTQDCSHSECSLCGEEDYDGEAVGDKQDQYEPPYDYADWP